MGPPSGSWSTAARRGLPLAAEEIQAELDRRRPGQSELVTPRKEADRVEIWSGLFEGRTTGAPISLAVRNTDARPGAYDEMKEKFRPSHADYTYQAKFGRRDHRGGGRSSARETIGRVAAGAIAKKILALAGPVEIRAFVTAVQAIRAPELDHFPTLAEVEASAVRCPHPATAAAMAELIQRVRSEGDSVGGVIQCRVRGVPAGLGEPVFDRLEADLAKAMLSLPATKGFEIGSGFAGTLLKGSEHNDAFRAPEGRIRHADQPLRRGPGRHQQRRGDPLQRRLQADGDHPAAAADGRRRRPGDRAQGPGPPRSLRPAARRPHCRGHGRPGPGRPLDAERRSEFGV